MTAAMLDQGARVVSPRVRLSETGFDACVTAAAFSADGTWALAGFGDGSAHVVAGPRTGTAIALGAVPLLAAPDTDPGAVLVGTDDGRALSVFAEGTFDQLVAFEDGWIDALAVSRAGATRAVASRRRVAVLDGSGAVRARLSGHPSTVSGLAFSPDATRLAASHYDGVTIHDLARGTVDRLYWHGSHTAIAWSPCGRFIATAMQDKELHVWRLADGKGFRMGGYPAKIRSLDWSDDGAYLLAGGADSVTAWLCADANPSGRPPLEFGYVFGAAVAQVAAHPRQPMAAGGYGDGTILIGEIETGSALIARPGGGGAVTALCFSPDGTVVLAGTEGGQVATMRLDAAMV